MFWWSIGASCCLILFGMVTSWMSPEGWIRTEVLFLVLMQVLQLIGILVADRCEHPFNLPITYLSFIHLALQPWTYNEWQWAIAELRMQGGRSLLNFTPQHKRLVRGLSWVFAVGLIMRAVPCFTEPCHYCSDGEHLCNPDGSPACTRQGVFHVYWRLPLRSNNYLWPGLWGHFALCFFPTAINGTAYDRLQMLLLFATGVAASFVVAYWGDPSTAFDEAASLWCLLAIPQHLIIFLAALRYQHELKAGALARQAAGFSIDAAPSLKLPALPGDDSESDHGSLDFDDEFDDDEDLLGSSDDGYDGDFSKADDALLVDGDKEEHTLVAVGDSGVTQVRRRKRL
mmetsp:Transcript_19524/g.35400  ORF Transcript_19524/g.35400 Transcript_19524/m.35400 type:complete len:342 (-) Transcript_19524:181-1206(-)